MRPVGRSTRVRAVHEYPRSASVAVFGTVLLPAILVGGRYYQDRGKEIEAAIAGLAATARAIAATSTPRSRARSSSISACRGRSDLGGRDKAACSNFLSEVREKNPQYHRHPDHRSRRQPVLRLPAHRARSSICATAAISSGRSNTAGAAVIEPAFGRLTGAAVLQIAYPARDEAQAAEVRSAGLARSQPSDAGADPESAAGRRGSCWSDRKGTVLVRSPSQLGCRRSRGAFDRRFRAVRLARKMPAEHRELAGADGEPQVWTAADTLADRRRQNACHASADPKSELVAAAEPASGRRHGRARHRCRSLLFAGVGLFAEFGIRSQIGRIAKMARAAGRRRSRGARIRRPIRGRTRQPDDGAEPYRALARTAAPRHRGTQRTSCGGRRNWRRWNGSGSTSPSTT